MLLQLSQLTRPLRTAINGLLELSYPGRCAVCRDACSGAAMLCESCHGKLTDLAQANACHHCGYPLQGDGSPCPRCLGKGLTPYERILRLGVFRDPLKELIHQLKYRGRWPLVERLADHLYAQERVRRLLEDCHCVIPVPLHRWRQIARGYNQSQVLASRLAKCAGRSLIVPAVRLRHTPTQTTFHSHARRQENLRDAFALLRPAMIRDRRIVVVDDVMTSGATLQSFGRALRQGRPASLSAIVLAVADPRHQDFQRI